MSICVNFLIYKNNINNRKITDLGKILKYKSFGEIEKIFKM